MIDSGVSAVFLVPFFGPLPPYFIHWVQSCEINRDDFQWILYSDQVRCRRRLNRAVTVVPYTFEEMRADFRRCLAIDIPDWNTRKVCDYDPMFYFLRRDREDLDQYEFIGYTDLDMIYGELRRFLPERMRRYGMISGDDGRPCGPFTLMRRTMMDRLREAPLVRDFITHPECTGFDETIELMKIFSCDTPVFCRASPLQPAMGRGFNFRQNCSVWRRGRVTVWDNRGHRREGGFHHFSRFKGRTRFRVRPEAISHPAWGVCKFGILPMASGRAFWRMALSLVM